MMNECNDANSIVKYISQWNVPYWLSHHPQQHCIQFLFTLGYDTYTSQQDNPDLMFFADLN
jgi:hypothetical protein